MIKRLKIQQFKSISHLDLALSKVNIFIGKPNTGKSNIAETLGLFSSFRYRHAALDRNPISTDFVRYGAITNLFRDNNLKNHLLVETDAISLTGSQEGEHVRFTLRKENNKRSTHNSSLYYLLGKDGYFKETNENEISVEDFIPNILFYRFKMLKQFPQTNFAYLLPPSGSNMIAIVQSNAELKDLIVSFLQPFGLKLNIRVEENKIEIAKDEKGLLVSYPLGLIADTFYYLFFHLAALLSCKDSLLIFEEPETRLFPHYTKYLSESIALDNTNNQFVITTHNPYFITSLVEKTPKENLAIFITYYENNETKIHKMTDKQIEEVLDWDSIFFNLDKYIE